MKIVVCIKQVPDTAEVKLDPKTGTLIREGVPSIINHDDKAGLESALQLREKLGGTVTVVCMGPPQADVALREALANCLVNADYYGRQGLVVIKKRDGITMSNPGNFRIEIDTAKSGGVSDPRNGTMLKMFNLIDIGERAGSGIPNIFRVWREQGWTAPVISESFDPDRIML